MDISSLTTGVSSASALANLVIVSPKNTTGYQPLAPPGSTGVALNPALLFHYEGENTATMQSDITDHYVENNTAINDMISLKPETVTVHGFIGDLNDVPANAALLAAKVIADKLVTISGYTPSLSATALEAYNEAVLAYQVAAAAAQAAVSAVNAFSGGGSNLAVIDGNGIDGNTIPGILTPFTSTQTPQQIMFGQFYGYWRKRTLFNIQTPWAIFQNMAIQTLRAVQDADTRTITDFEVTFKIMRFAATTQVTIGQGVWNQQNATAVASQATLGNTSVTAPGATLPSGGLP